MQKRIITPDQQETILSGQNWLNLEDLVDVEISSEDSDYPIEGALLLDKTSRWRAAEPGMQTIRLVFNAPQGLRQIRLSFVETEVERTQEYVLRWSSDGGQSFHEIVRQQWNFNPQDTTKETEDHHVELEGVTILELSLLPEIGGGEAIASLEQLRLA